MQKGTCPKCGKKDVRVSRPGRNGGQGALVASAFSWARPLTYVCVACGYVEQWVNDRRFLDKLAEKWDRVR